MPKYSIPTQVQNGFKFIITLNTDELNVLSNIIKKAKIGQGIKYIVEENFTKFSDFDKNKFEQIIIALFSMANIYLDSKNNLEQFILDFSESFECFFQDTSSAELDKLKSCLTKLLPNFNSIILTTKTRELFTENPKNMLETRIVSDIRIVFDDEINAKAQSAIIIHNLKIDYFNDFDKKSFFVSLDLSDLKKLQKVIERAIEKDNSIRSNNLQLNFVDLI